MAHSQLRINKDELNYYFGESDSSYVVPGYTGFTESTEDTEDEHEDHFLWVTEDEYEQLYASILDQTPYNSFVTLQSLSPEEPGTSPRAIKPDNPIDRRLFELGVERTEPQQYYRWTDKPSYFNFKKPTEVPYHATIMVLGEGKFGEVSVVSHHGSDIPLARKEFTTKHQSLSEAEEKFVQEVRLMDKLTDRGIVKHRVMVENYFAVRNYRYFLLMRPVASDGNLNQFLDKFRGGNSSTEPILREAIGCLTATLAAIHEQGILHRDIHGGNILFHENTVLYADFGSSTLLETEGSDSDYTAPELQISNSYTEKADAFGLAAVLDRIWSHLVWVPHGHPSPSMGEKELLDRLISGLRQHEPGDRLTAKRAAIDIYTSTNADAGLMCASCRQWCGERVDNNGVLRRKLLLPFTIPDYLQDSDDSR